MSATGERYKDDSLHGSGDMAGVREGSRIMEEAGRPRGSANLTSVRRRDFQHPGRDTPTPSARRIPEHDSIESTIANMATGRAPSSTPVPTTETAESAGATSTVTAPEWEAMANLLKNVYDYRIDE